jgi:4-oxalocrotonate tautomerase
MPLINATFALPPSPEITRRTVRALTALTVEALGKELERTTVIVRYVPPGQWARGGVQSDLGGARHFVVEAHISAGTNSREEKAQFIRQTHAELETILGEDAAGYVIVREIDADSWQFLLRMEECSSPTS